MKRIEFDITLKDEIIAGNYKVFTSYGEPVEIVKWNCVGNYPLLAVFFDGNTDDAAFFDNNGKGMNNQDSNYLYLVPVNNPQKTDFEIEVHEIITQARTDRRLNHQELLEQFEKETACALLMKARKQIEAESKVKKN